MYIYDTKKAGKERLDLLLSAILCGLLAADVVIAQWTDIRVYPPAYEILVNLFFIAFSLYKLLYGIKSASLASVRRYTDAIIPVSYTHLDVYKRQTLPKPHPGLQHPEHPVSSARIQLFGPLKGFFQFHGAVDGGHDTVLSLIHI